MSAMTKRPEERLADVVAEVAWVRRLAIAVASDAHTADDIAQDALLAASNPGVRQSGNLRSWPAGVRSGATPLALNVAAIFFRSSQVSGGWTLFSANIFLL